MKSSQKKQYTIRNLSHELDAKLRQKAREEGKSLNEVALESLRKGSGLADTPVHYHDLDHLIRSWHEDPDFDEAIQLQDQVDPELWS